MKSYLLKCLLGLAMILPGWNGNLASGQETSTQEKEVGFTSLFDGKTLKGWEGNREIFRVQQGAIIAGSLPQSATPAPVRKIRALILTLIVIKPVFIHLIKEHLNHNQMPDKHYHDSRRQRDMDEKPAL